MASPVTPTAVEPPLHIVGLTFSSEPDAQHALHEAWRLHEANRLALHDAVLLSAEHGPAEVVESMDPTPIAAAVPASLFGALVGALVAGPLGFLIGGVIAGSTGAVVAKLVDTGIPHRIVAQLRARTKPGEATVALLVSDPDDAHAIDELRALPGARVVLED